MINLIPPAFEKNASARKIIYQTAARVKCGGKYGGSGVQQLNELTGGWEPDWALEMTMGDPKNYGAVSEASDYDYSDPY